MKRWLYFVAATGVCSLLSLVVLTVYVLVDVGVDTRSTAPTERLVCPGEHIVQLSDSGLHYIYFEYVARYDSVAYTMDSLPYRTSATVKDGAVGEAGPVRRAESQVRYSWPGRAGLSLFEFNVIKPGDFTIDVSFDAPERHGPLVFAVGSAVSMVSWMEHGLILFVGSFVMFYLAAIVLWRRKIREYAHRRNSQARR